MRVSIVGFYLRGKHVEEERRGFHYSRAGVQIERFVCELRINLAQVVRVRRESEVAPPLILRNNYIFLHVLLERKARVRGSRQVQGGELLAIPSLKLRTINIVSVACSLCECSSQCCTRT